MSTPAVEVRNVSKSFPGVRAVNELSLSVDEGRFLALVGPSGCGKTTTLRVIAGFDRTDVGTVHIRGRVIDAPHTFVPPERRAVGMVFQDYALFPHLTVRQNVAFGLGRSARLGGRVEHVLELVRLTEVGERMPHELSGGEQQRVALARAIAPAPAVVLLDEPFSNLDASLRVRVRAEVRQILRSTNTAAIFVTHDQDEALSFADHVGVMLEGRVLQVGTPQEVYASPSSLSVATFLGNANILPGHSTDSAVATELGTLQVSGQARGPVHVVVRPECVALSPAADEHGLEVIDREFYGHDQMLRLRLPSGTALQVRCGPETLLRVGDRVRASVRGPVRLFTPEAT